MTVQQLVWELTKNCEPNDKVRIATGPFGRYSIMSVQSGGSDFTCWIDIQRDMKVSKEAEATHETRTNKRRASTSKSKLRQVSGRQGAGESK